jgi:quercetin dioxygenase-like cupin family protein
MDVANLESLARFSSEKYVRVPLGDTKGLVRLLCFEPKQEVPLHLHPEADEIFYVVKGAAVFIMGEETTQVLAGSLAKADAGTRHGWKNGSDNLILLSVLIPVSAYHVAEQATRMEFV